MKYKANKDVLNRQLIQKGITLAQLAVALDLDRKTLYRKINLCGWKRSEVTYLSDLLGVNPHFLFPNAGLPEGGPPGNIKKDLLSAIKHIEVLLEVL